MKRMLSLALMLILAFSLTSCGMGTNNVASDSTSTSNEHSPVSITPSPDKYTWYVKDYVGKNCASFGYTSMGGDRRDTYGEGNIELIFVYPDGSYVDFDDEDILKEYVVTEQNVSPNTEIKYTFQTDSDGEEYGLVDYKNIEEIVLKVKKLNEKEVASKPLTEIHTSPNPNTWYIADYVGRNLAYCGYTSLGGDRRAAYGDCTVKLVLVTEDGSYIDLDDDATMQEYVVTSQSVAPNSEIHLTFNDSTSFVSSQNIDEIELYVKHLTA